jgi:hypothetical protein
MTRAWHPAPRRTPAALGAVALTSALLLALNAAPPRQPAPVPPSTVLFVALPALPPPQSAVLPRPLPAPETGSLPRHRAAELDEKRRAAEPPLPANASTAPPWALAESPPFAASAPDPAASAPLKLDAATLRAAARGSRSDARLQAEASGRELGSGEMLTAQQRLARDTASAGKPDCVGPDSGGSLLSIPLIAYQALAGHCR